MSLLELTLTVAIAAILFAMVLGLAQHVNHISKIRRAQAELAYWHTAIDAWHAQFGEYPCFDMRRHPERNDTSRLCDKAGTSGTIRNLENVVSNACVHLYGEDGTILGEKFFSEFVAGTPSHIDPWGTPYLYIPADEDPDDTISNPRITYLLLSCGPNGKSPEKGDKDEKTRNDDVYFGH